MAVKPKKSLIKNYDTKIGGEIAYFGLQDWWMNDLTVDERDIIFSLYNPFGFDKKSLIEGKITYTDEIATAFLTGLLSYLKKPEYQKLSSKIIKKMDRMSLKSGSVLDRHFYLSNKIEIFYRNRNTDETALPAAIDACKEQISIAEQAKRAYLKEYDGSLPSHLGYTQLCIILEKQKNYDEVIHLARPAKEQGWMGDWDKRIERSIRKRDQK